MSFIIVGRDRPVYELPMSGGREELARQSQFILHAALDMVELNMQANPLTCVGGAGERIRESWGGRQSAELCR